MTYNENKIRKDEYENVNEVLRIPSFTTGKNTFEYTK